MAGGRQRQIGEGAARRVAEIDRGRSCELWRPEGSGGQRGAASSGEKGGDARALPFCIREEMGREKSLWTWPHGIDYN